MMPSKWLIKRDVNAIKIRLIAFTSRFAGSLTCIRIATSRFDFTCQTAEKQCDSSVTAFLYRRRRVLPLPVKLSNGKAPYTSIFSIYICGRDRS